MKCPSCHRPLPQPKFRCGVWTKASTYSKPHPCEKRVAKDGQTCKRHRMKR